MTDREEGRRTRRSTGREDAGRGHIRPEGEGRLEGEKGRNEEETETRESGEPVGPRVRQLPASPWTPRARGLSLHPQPSLACS